MAQTENQGLYQLYTTEFATNVELLLQQKSSKLRGKVNEKAHTGKMASPINQVGALSLKAPAGRGAPMPTQSADLFRRWVFPQDGELPQLIDTFDELKTIVNLQSPFAESAAAAVNRAWDDSVISAFFGTANLGQDAGGLTQETFSTTNFQVSSTFGSGSASGLTIAKIIEAKRILEHYHNDLESDMACMVIGSQQHADLFNQVQIVDQLGYRGIDAQVTGGRVRSILGIDIVMSERLSVSANVRNVPVFVKSGMHLGIWKDMTNVIDYRPDISSRPLQLLTQTSFGSTRLQAGKVISILCSDSTGTDINP
jgi:hypothetical protein